MTPHPQPTTRTRITRATLFLAIGGALFFLAGPASAANDTAVCHATGSESNPYVLIMISAAGAYNGHLGDVDDHQGGEDIIPPFSFGGETYSQNWDLEGQAIFAACPPAEDPEETPSETSTSTNGPDQHTICHATGSESNPYEVISPSVEGVFNGHLGDVDDHQNGEDIIPPFTYEGTEYSQNWDAAGQAIFDDGCELENDTDTETSGSETDTETSGSDTDSETDPSEPSEPSETGSETSGSDTGTETEEIPVFGTASTLALGVVGALGGSLLMLRRKL